MMGRQSWPMTTRVTDSSSGWVLGLTLVADVAQFVYTALMEARGQ